MHALRSARARPVLRRLGLEERMRRAGAQPNHTHVCTPWGWWSTHSEEHGWNLRRSALDPMVRDLALTEPGVELRTASRSTRCCAARTVA